MGTFSTAAAKARGDVDAAHKDAQDQDEGAGGPRGRLSYPAAAGRGLFAAVDALLDHVAQIVGDLNGELRMMGHHDIASFLSEI